MSEKPEEDEIDTGNESAADPNGPVIIKRYASRKLYDAAAREYVTLEDIAKYIREGREVKIIDKKSGEDLTRQYLVQIIADFESQGESALPLNVLTDLVRHYQDQAKSLAPAFLSQVFEAFKEQQEKVLGEFGSIQGKVFDPNSAMNAMKLWQEKQAEFFNRGMQEWGQGWGMGSAKPARSEPAQKPPGNAPENNVQTTHGDDNKSSNANAAKIAEMEAHLKALQDQLNKLR